MKNPYRRLKKIVENEEIGSEELLHTLLASVFSECCETCNAKLHSEEFADSFHHLVKELRFCKNLSKRELLPPRAAARPAVSLWQELKHLFGFPRVA
jgi:hypothetical protein